MVRSFRLASSRIADDRFLHTALKSGVADIARTFGEKLVAFKFPSRTAKKLQSFVDYA